jgi:xanthine dehydrogenase YagS FAD-binding subunit
VAVHPSDVAPALVALDAEVQLVSARGARVVPLAALLQPPTAAERIEHRAAPDEVLTEVHVPAQPDGARGVYLKAMDRAAWSFALASAAVQLTLRAGRVEQARLVLGGVAAVPWRAREAEALLEGQPLTAQLAAAAADRAVAGALPLAHNGFKVALARELARRALLRAAADTTHPDG